MANMSARPSLASKAQEEVIVISSSSSCLSSDSDGGAFDLATPGPSTECFPRLE